MAQHDIKLVWSGLDSEDLAAAVRLDPAKLPTGFLDVHQWSGLPDAQYFIDGGHPRAQLRRAGPPSSAPLCHVWSRASTDLPLNQRNPRALRRMLESTTVGAENVGDIATVNGHLYVVASLESDLNQMGFSLAQWPAEERAQAGSVSVASLRVDAVAAAVARLSRSDAQAAASNGYMFLNFAPLHRPATAVRPGDQLVIQGRGRISIVGTAGVTRSGRQRLEYHWFPL